MRAVRWMAWALVGLVVCMLAGLTAGCMSSQGAFDKESAGLDETDPDELPEAPLAQCAGVCQPEPPLPFNPRIHLIWIGNPRLVTPDCPAEANLPGFAGEVVSMASAPDWPKVLPGDRVRECLISADHEGCENGTTCAPPAPRDYRLCVSRENQGQCPADHYAQHIVAREDGAATEDPGVILCCTAPQQVR